MAEKQNQDMEQVRVVERARAEVPRVPPRIAVEAGVIGIEFRIEDLVRRVIPSAAGHCGGCYGCSGCSM